MAFTDPWSVAAVLAAGAAGVRAGTRFVATTESGAHPRHEQALVDAGEGSTGVSGAFRRLADVRTSPRARVLVSAVEALEATTGQVEVVMASYAGDDVSAVHDLPGADALRHLCSALP